MDVKKFLRKYGWALLTGVCGLVGAIAEANGKESKADKLDSRVEKLEKLVGETTKKTN